MNKHDETEALERLVGDAVRTCAATAATKEPEPNPMSGPPWANVAHIFQLGSTSAIALCRRFRVNPHAKPAERKGL